MVLFGYGVCVNATILDALTPKVAGKKKYLGWALV